MSVTTNGVTVTYGYNGFGQRVKRTTGGSSVYSVYDGDDLLLEVSGSGALLREYAHYPGVDHPHSMRDAAGNVYNYSMESPGHVSGLFNAANQVVNQYRYSPWGEMETVTENVQQPFRYMGRELDPITGLYYVRNRWYDPVASRFVSEDPIGLTGGINLYAYADNSPTNLRDPSGLDPDGCPNGRELDESVEAYSRRCPFRLAELVASVPWPFSIGRSQGNSGRNRGFPVQSLLADGFAETGPGEPPSSYSPEDLPTCKEAQKGTIVSFGLDLVFVLPLRGANRALTAKSSRS